MFKLPRLYAIVDTGTLGDRAEPAALALLEAGVTLLQYRHKEDFTRAHFEVCRRLAAACRTRSATLVINDRADIALMCGADGVHLGQDDLPPAEVRSIVGAGMIIGFSTHNLEQVRAAAEYPVDYLAIGPVYATATKKNPDPVVGLAGVAEARRAATRPLVAIGGITRDNAAAVLAAGADCVAVVRDLIAPPDVAASARDFLSRLSLVLPGESQSGRYRLRPKQ